MSRFSRDDLGPYEREMLDILDLIVAEFESDLMSVQYFDKRIVERANNVVEIMNTLYPKRGIK